MYRKLLKILLLSLPLAGCAYDPAYDSPAVYTSSTVYTGVYATPPSYYGGTYYVRPAPRYYVPPPVYYRPPPVYYRPPPVYSRPPPPPGWGHGPRPGWGPPGGPGWHGRPPPPGGPRWHGGPPPPGWR